MKSITLSPAGQAILAAAKIEPDRLFLPDQRIDRALYVEIDKFLQASGGKWDKRAKAHVFPKGTEGLSAQISAGTVDDLKRSYEQFFTPEALAAELISLADLRPGQSVLEPSAGDGALIRAAVSSTHDLSIWAYEIDPILRAKLTSDFFPQFGSGGLACDFMEAAGRPAFDRVIMNPPFGRGKDMAHVLKAFSMLKPGGRLVAIMSPHWTFASDKASADFRLWVDQIGAIWTPNPEGSFKQSGTGVSTGILVADCPEV